SSAGTGAGEGNFPFMYCDLPGYVTIGVGHLLTVQVKGKDGKGMPGSKDQKLIKSLLEEYDLKRFAATRHTPGEKAITTFSDVGKVVGDKEVIEEFNFLTDHRDIIGKSFASKQKKHGYVSLEL